jgi:hypothetical protein
MKAGRNRSEGQEPSRLTKLATLRFFHRDRDVTGSDQVEKLRVGVNENRTTIKKFMKVSLKHDPRIQRACVGCIRNRVKIGVETTDEVPEDGV